MYEINVTKVWKMGKRGKYMGFKTSKRKAASLTHFQLQCQSFRNVNHQKIASIKKECLQWISEGKLLRVDTWFAFENSRIWTKDGQPKVIDADNRRKPMQDGLAQMLGIDDKWFFSGNIEKVTCVSKEYECTIIRILPVKARTLTEIQAIRNTAAF